MDILIPLGGTGQRFKIKGYSTPKALIKVNNKPIIFYVLDNLILDNIKNIYIPYNKEYTDIEEILQDRYPTINFKFMKLQEDTRGAAETIHNCLDNFTFDDDHPIICIDSDNFYLTDIISKWKGNNCIFTFNDFSKLDIYSYVKVENNQITDIREKHKISTNACCGAYGFESHILLKRYCKYIIDNYITQKGEFYVSGVIKQMLQDGIVFRTENIRNRDYFSLGTPEQIDQYMKPYLFDLDGTIVNTDHIYTKVWKDILSKYNITIDKRFFNFFIQGKNDSTFLKYIFPEITDSEICEISKIKDELFIKYLSLYEDNITVNGFDEFIIKNKNRRMCIVTSSNRTSAEFIVHKIGIDEYIQFIIASDDCENHKPHGEPYNKAIDMLDTDPSLCTIFEDSVSGYKSATEIANINICIVIHDNTPNELLDNIEYKITNYDKFDETKIHKRHNSDFIDVIQTCLKSMTIDKIYFEDTNIKSGYICDIKALNVHTSDTIENIVVKIQNNNNELSNVATKINLYNNETYFYNNLSTIINVSSPLCYGTLNHDDKNIILLENLNKKYHGNFDINLNDNIDLLLTITKNIVHMHNKFSFNKESDIIQPMKSLPKISDITYYSRLIHDRFDTFIENNKYILSTENIKLLTKIYTKFNDIVEHMSSFPLNFCHGDLKSPNIFYKDNIEPIFLDWQYIHLNKGITDIIFLLIESTEYNEHINNTILNYYYIKSNMYTNYEKYLHDLKCALCVFPFFVMVWFNSENKDTLIDKIFPLVFMKNTLKFYNHYLDDDFFVRLS